MALDSDVLARMDAYWRAANYLSVGQIYLLDNPLLREPLRPEHIKPRLLGHWGTTPGQNFIYVHLNRAIVEHDLDMIYIAGPGHGGPALVANTYLEGTYSEIYPAVTRDEDGLKGDLAWWDFGAVVSVLPRPLHFIVFDDQSCCAPGCRGCRNDSVLHKENTIPVRPDIPSSRSGGRFCSI